MCSRVIFNFTANLSRIDHYSVDELEGDIEHLLFTSNVPKKFIFDAMDLMHKWLWLYAKIPVQYEVGIDVFLVCLKISKDYHHGMRYELADWAFCMGFGVRSLEYHEAHLVRFGLWLAESSEFAGCAISRRWKKAWKRFLKRRALGKKRAKTA